MTDPETPAPSGPATGTAATTATDIITKADKIATDIQTITTDVATAATDVATANLWTAIVGFFTALPGIVALIRDVMTWLNKVSGNNPQAFIATIGQAFSQLANAKTQEDYSNAAQNLASTIGKLPSA